MPFAFTNWLIVLSPLKLIQQKEFSGRVQEAVFPNDGLHITSRRLRITLRALVDVVHLWQRNAEHGRYFACFLTASDVEPIGIFEYSFTYYVYGRL